MCIFLMITVELMFMESGIICFGMIIPSRFLFNSCLQDNQYG